MWVSLGALAAFLLMVGAVITLVVLQHVQADKADQALASLQRLVEDNNVDEARNFIDQLTAESPRIAADPRIQEIGSQLTRRLRDEDSRRRSLAAAMDLVRKSIGDQLPDKDALARAKKLATSDEEKAAIRKAEQDIAKLSEAVQSKVDQDFLAQLKEIKDRVGPVERDVDDKPDASIKKLDDLLLEVKNLLALHSKITEAARAPAELLRTRLKALGDEARTVTDRLGSEEAITTACGDTAALRQKLLQYAEKFPQARHSASFRAVAADEAPLWDWVGRWNDTVQAVGRANCAGIDRNAAAQMILKLRKLLDDRPGHPDAETFRQRLPYLEAIVRRTDAEGNSIEAALKPVFTDPLLAGVWMLADTEGRRYYMLEDPATKLGSLAALKPGRTYGFEYVIGFDLSKRRTSLRGDDIKADRPLAPQRTTARTLAAILEGISDSSWERSFCQMIETVVNDKETDPLLKHFLLRKIVDVGGQGSLCLRRGFEGYADLLLKHSKVPSSVNWVDPNNSEAVAQRGVAEADLDKLPRFIDAQNATAKEWKSLGAAIGTELACVGWLRKNLGGDWQCLTRPGCPQTGKLVTVRAAEAGAEGRKAAVFEAVGRLDKGKALIDAEPGPAMADGRLVYVVRPPN